MITDVTLLADTLTVSGELQKIFADHMLNGQMPLAISTWSTTRHEVPATDKFDIQTTRSISLLKTAFLTFDTDPTERLQGINPTSGALETVLTRQNLTNATCMFNPQSKWQLVIDTRVWPVMPCRGIGETYMRLRQALDLNRYGYLNITKEAFQTTSFVIGCDVEKGASTIDGGASFTGIQCRSGSPITFRIRGLGGTQLGAVWQHKAKVAFIHLAHDVVINVTQGGVESFE